VSEQFENQTTGVSEDGIAVERKVTTVVKDGESTLHTGYTIQHGKTRMAFTEANWAVFKRLLAELGTKP